MGLISLNEEARIKLDQHDKKILFYLSQDSSLVRKKLAEKLRLSPQLLHYKIQRLESTVIQPLALINYPLLGLEMYLLFVPKLNTQDRSKIMENSSIVFLIQSIGRYQYILNVLTNDIITFCENALSGYHVEIYKISKQIPDFFNPFGIGKHPDLLKKDKKMELDKKDYLILSHLSKYPLDPLIKIGQELNIDRQTVKIRLAQLRNANIIQKFRYTINVFKLGFLVYLMHVRVIPQHRLQILTLIRSDKYSGMAFELNNGFFFFYMPSSHNQLFTFVEELQKFDSTIFVDIFPSSEFFKVDPNPKFASDYLLNMSKSK